MASKSKLEQMQILHSMCQREVEQLQHSLSLFLLESARMQHLLGQHDEKDSARGRSDSDNVFALMTFDRYMSQVGTIVNMARKFNIHLKLNDLNKVVVEGGILGGGELTPQRLFREFMQWNSVLRPREEYDFDLVSTSSIDAVSGGDGISLLNKYNAIEEATTAVTSASLGSKLTLTGTESQSTTSSSSSGRKVRFGPHESAISGTLTTATYIQIKDLSRFNEGYKFTAAITYIEDYERLTFYICQMGSNDLLELSNMLHLHRYKYPPPNNEVFGISINNENILRAVLKQETGNNAASVLLIDFGEVVPLSDNCQLYQIPWKYKNIPAQAIKCILLGVNESHDDHGDERDSDYIYLAAVLERYEFKEVQFKVVRRLGRVLHLRLYENHLAEKMEEFKRVEDEIKEENRDKSKDIKNPFINSSHDDRNHESKFDVEQDAKAAIPLAALTQTNKQIWDKVFECESVTNKVKDDCTTAAPIDNTCTAYNTTLQTFGERPKSLVKAPTSSITSLVEEIDHNMLRISVTHVLGVDCFYAQIINNTNQLDTLCWSDDELQPNQKLWQLPHLNDVVLAKYIKDDYWYRAKVVEIDVVLQLLKVFYLDFGNTETVPLGCLAKCKLSQTTDEPFRAVRFRLADVRDITGEDKQRFQQAVQSLVIMLLNQTFSVRVMSRTDKEILIRVVDEEFAGLTQMLISMGYARQIQS